MQICLLYTYIYTHTHIPFIVGEKGISGADAGYPPLPTDLLRRGVTALQPTAAFAKLNPSRRQDEQPEKWLGSGRGRVPELSGGPASPRGFHQLGWKQMFCSASTDAVFLLCSCAGSKMLDANWGHFSWDFYGFPERGFDEVRSVKQSLEPHRRQ